jgi:hypothetical protein
MPDELFPTWGYQMPLSWQDRIEAADDEAEVVGVVRDFLAQISPQEFSRLPKECWPGKLVDAEDVTSYGFTLMRQACSSSDPTSDMVHRLVAFISNACIRLAQITGRSHAHAGEAHQSV